MYVRIWRTRPSQNANMYIRIWTLPLYLASKPIHTYRCSRKKISPSITNVYTYIAVHTIHILLLTIHGTVLQKNIYPKLANLQLVRILSSYSLSFMGLSIRMTFHFNLMLTLRDLSACNKIIWKWQLWSTITNKRLQRY